VLPEYARFFGHPVSLELETRRWPTEESPPRPSVGEVDLASLILANIPEVLAVCEREYAACIAEFPEILAKIDRPRVWICREFQEREGLDTWAFETGIADAPDWSICVEFKGLDFLEIWSGD
jgi:hypothetical protein